ncbi:TPA: hypothetical protein HA344_05870 [Candidatus Bathyarchaeota archaeon]|nr:hypothetical protein [Candidatus Bathyarchaeota archaeon]
MKTSKHHELKTAKTRTHIYTQESLLDRTKRRIIFVFNAGVNNESVGYELKHASDHLLSKLETTLIAVDTSGRCASTLMRGHIKMLNTEKKVHIARFHDDESLFKASRNASIIFLKTMTPILTLSQD